MELGIQVAQYLAFAYGLFQMISSNAKLLRQTRQDIQEKYLKRREEFATHGLKKAFLRILALTIMIAITVRYADLKVFWGVLLTIFLIGYLATAWLMTKQLPEALPEISQERVDREFKAKWWTLAFQFILFIAWLYSWRHLYNDIFGILE